MHRKTKSDGIIQTLNISQQSNINNNNNNNETSSLYEELFDPSMIFVGIHSCYYWDSFDRIRKGKIFLTKTELLFKCSRMPFVRVRLYLNEVESIIKVKNFKNQSDSVLLISSNNNNLIKSFAFYKFRLPKNIIKNNILSLVKNLRQTNDDTETTTKGSKFNLSSKIRKSVTDLKNIIKTPNHMSKSNSDLINNSNNNIENMDYLRNNDYLKKSASNSFLDSSSTTTTTVVFRKLNNTKQQNNDLLLQQERKFSSLANNKKTMRRVKRSSKDSDSNTSPELEEKNDKKQGIFIKNNKSRPASTNSYQDNTTVNQIINNKRPASMNETKRESISNKAEYLKISNQQINELNLAKKNTSARSSKMSSSSSVSTSSTSSSQDSFGASSLSITQSIKETDINEYKKQIKEQLRLNSIVKNNNNNQESEYNNLNRISMNNNHIQTNNNNNNGLGSNFLIIFFLIAILIYSLMTIVNFVKLCFLENSINFDL